MSHSAVIAHLKHLAIERGAVHYNFGKQYDIKDYDEMTRSIDLLAKIDAEIQRIVGCSCQHTGGGSECGMVMLDKDLCVEAGCVCPCVCHRLIMYRLTPAQKVQVDMGTFQYTSLATLRIMRDDWAS